MNANIRIIARVAEAGGQSFRRCSPWALALLWLVLPFAPGPARAQTPAAITGVDVAALPGDTVQVVLTASAPLPQPRSFSTENPARIVIDFDGIGVQMDKKTVDVGVGLVRSVTAVEAGGRTRVVVNLTRGAPHKIQLLDDRAVLTVSGATAVAGTAASKPAVSSREGGAPKSPAAESTASSSMRVKAGERSIEDVDFRRGTAGEGRVVVTLSDPNTVVDLQKKGAKLVAVFSDTKLPDKLMRHFDVTDFATPITAFDVRRQGGNVELVIEPTGTYEHLAYQADNQFTVEVRPLTPAEKEAAEQRKKVFTGERLSLNFQDIEVRSVLQLLADFTGLNMVVSDTVRGNITLRLQNVPWDQAMDIILKTKGLSMRKNGNVILVAPTEEITAREKLELESHKQIQELAPLVSEYIQINYAKAEDIAKLLKTKENQLLSPRGNVTTDERTNTLLVQDTEANLEDIRRLVQKLDIPVRQVIIESRIVLASDTFTRDIGVRFGFNRANRIGNGTELLVAGGLPGTTAGTGGLNTGSFMGVGAGIVQGGATGENAIENLMVDLPAAGPTGALDLLIGKVGSFLLQLELNAAQQEGKAEVISSPRVVTANQSKATIKSGVEIPYQEASSAGNTSVSFKQAVLQLEVTPQITPDDRVFMDLSVKKDTPDYDRSVLGTPPINTKTVETSVLVDNGETVVLGGIFERTKSDNYAKVPFFADLPAVGQLFKQHGIQDENSELLVFVTPKILKETLGTQ